MISFYKVQHFLKSDNFILQICTTFIKTYILSHNCVQHYLIVCEQMRIKLYILGKESYLAWAQKKTFHISYVSIKIDVFSGNLSNCFCNFFQRFPLFYGFFGPKRATLHFNERPRTKLAKIIILKIYCSSFRGEQIFGSWYISPFLFLWDPLNFCLISFLKAFLWPMPLFLIINHTNNAY
jgi:hypothetical protein